MKTLLIDDWPDGSPRKDYLLAELLEVDYLTLRSTTTRIYLFPSKQTEWVVDPGRLADIMYRDFSASGQKVVFLGVKTAAAFGIANHSHYKPFTLMTPWDGELNAMIVPHPESVTLEDEGERTRFRAALLGAILE